MKVKSAVLASALVAVSSVFADIYTNGDIYNSWFTAGSDTPTPIDTDLDRPTIVNGSTSATASNGYAVTAEVTVVIHATRPDVPTALDNVNPKGSICAAYDGGVAKWYGLQKVSDTYSWVELTGIAAPSEGLYTLVTEFDDKGDGVNKVRYWVDSASSGWFTSGHANPLQKVGLAGTGSYKKVVGLLVNAWTETNIDSSIPISISKTMLAAMGVSTGNTTPAEIVTALTTPEKNGIAKWANYALGINGTVAANKPFAAPVQNNNSSELTFKLGGVNANTEVADVKYAIETLASPDAASGDPSAYVAAGSEQTITLDSKAVKYYRVKVQIDEKKNN